MQLSENESKNVKRKLKHSFLVMPRLYQFLNVLRTNDIHQRRVLIIIFTLWALWFAGYFDFLRETDFQYFKWPPYVNVRNQVSAV